MECTIREDKNKRDEPPQARAPERPSFAELIHLPRRVFEQRVEDALTPERREEIRKQLGI